MWLLAGVRLLRALRMSHRLTFFTLPTARAVPLLCWVVVARVGFLCLVLCFACAAGIFLIIVADVSR